MQRVLRKNAVLSLFLVVIVMMNIGGFLSSQMMMEDGTMHSCPYMGVTALCNMSLLEHMSQWQQMFTTTVQHITTGPLLQLMVLVIVWVYLKQFLYSRTERFLPRSRYRERSFDPLRLAFARGILHTKVY